MVSQLPRCTLIIFRLKLRHAYDSRLSSSSDVFGFLAASWERVAHIQWKMTAFTKMNCLLAVALLENNSEKKSDWSDYLEEAEKA